MLSLFQLTFVDHAWVLAKLKLRRRLRKQLVETEQSVRSRASNSPSEECFSMILRIIATIIAA